MESMKHPENATCRHLSGIHGIGLMGFRVGPEPTVVMGRLSQGQGRLVHLPPKGNPGRASVGSRRTP